jgi:hypothetical protein
MKVQTGSSCSLGKYLKGNCENRVCLHFFAYTNLDVDWNVAPVESPFSRRSLAHRSNQLCLNIWIELLLPKVLGTVKAVPFFIELKTKVCVPLVQ